MRHAKRRRARRNLPRSLLGRILGSFLILTVLPVLVLRWLPPPTSAFMLEARWNAWLSGERDFKLSYQWTDWDLLSPDAALAVIAAEDQRFNAHFGFDFHAISKALQRNRQGGTVRGASTISQQTAKNLFLSSSRSLFRKGFEAYLTLLIETLWPKRRILEVYLNIAQFGKGVYGLEAAGERFFGQPARGLGPREAALLAATLPNPLKLRAEKPSGYVIKRRDWILNQMRRLGGSDYLVGL
jgi:monofunctional glycosyltransferase